MTQSEAQTRPEVSNVINHIKKEGVNIKKVSRISQWEFEQGNRGPKISSGTLTFGIEGRWEIGFCDSYTQEVIQKMIKWAYSPVMWSESGPSRLL